LGRPEWKELFGRTGHKYDEIVKTYFEELEFIREIDSTALAEWYTGVLL